MSRDTVPIVLKFVWLFVVVAAFFFVPLT